MGLESLDQSINGQIVLDIRRNLKNENERMKNTTGLDSIGTVEFLFHPSSESVKLKGVVTALVKTKNGYDIAEYENKSWYSVGSLIYAGGCSGDITDEVLEFSIID